MALLLQPRCGCGCSGCTAVPADLGSAAVQHARPNGEPRWLPPVLVCAELLHTSTGLMAASETRRDGQIHVTPAHSLLSV
jgi:hypothetical protein